MTNQTVTLEESERAFYDWQESPMPETIQDRPPNFRSDEGHLYLVRCYACDPEYGRENYVLMVSSGQCAWCGWKEEKEAEVVEATT